MLSGDGEEAIVERQQQYIEHVLHAVLLGMYSYFAQEEHYVSDSR